MKVLQLIQKPQLRGAEVFACQLSKELIKLGMQVDVAYLFDDRQELKASFPDLKFINVSADQEKRFWDFGAYRKIASLITDGGYDIVQANAGDTLKYAAISRVLYRWKGKLIFRNANKMSGFIRNGFHKFINHQFVRQSDYVISVSENCKADIKNMFGLEGRVEAIPIGTYKPQTTSEKLSSEGTVIINMSSFVPEKNHAFLLEIFEDFLKVRPNARLWLVGDGALRLATEAIVKHKQLATSVKFWGYRTDAVDLLASADVLLMPSLIEGIPGVILEAFARRIPVVASNVGGVGEVVIDGQTGRCIKGWRIDAYVNALSEIIEPSKARSLSESAYQLFLSNFQMPVIGSRFYEAYQKVAATNLRK